MKTIFSYLFIALTVICKNLQAQTTEKDYCLLNSFSMIRDSSLNSEVYNPLIGITLTGNQDTIYSFINGSVVDILFTQNNLATVKIQNGNDVISIGFLKNVVLKTNDNIKSGDFIGTLNKKTASTYLWIIIYQSGIILNKEEAYKYLKKSCISN